MSSGPKLDGAGVAKLETLEEASAQIQRMHGIVEHMAMAVRSQQNTAQFGPQLRRVGSPLVGLLKGQFGMIADQVTAVLLIATRSGGDQVKLRSLRATCKRPARSAVDAANSLGGARPRSPAGHGRSQRNPR